MALCLVLFLSLFSSAQSRIDVLYGKAVDDLQEGRIAEAVAGFDEVARLNPAVAPELWQRGIALYYAGRYADCRRQFELHRTVNPDDVENAAWHFLCAAKAESADKARDRLLPVGPDPRAPMREVYDMFRGKLTPERVLAAGEGQRAGEFYAHLYVGLYYDAMGRRQDAVREMSIAADDRYARVGGYMHAMARIHLRALQAVGGR